MMVNISPYLVRLNSHNKPATCGACAAGMIITLLSFFAVWQSSGPSNSEKPLFNNPPLYVVSIGGQSDLLMVMWNERDGDGNLTTATTTTRIRMTEERASHLYAAIANPVAGSAPYQRSFYFYSGMRDGKDGDAFAVEVDRNYGRAVKCSFIRSMGGCCSVPITFFDCESASVLIQNITPANNTNDTVFTTTNTTDI